MPVDPDYTIPLGVGEIKREGTDVTVVTYGKMLRRVVQAAEELAEEGISVEIVDPRTLVPVSYTHLDVYKRQQRGDAGMGSL